MAPRRVSCLRCGRPLPQDAPAAARGICVSCGATRPDSLPRGRDTGVVVLQGPADGLLGPFEPPPPGTDLGGIVVERRLGEGGMGHVLVARDRGLDRLVAVKFLRASLVGNERAERFFRREGRALAGIDNPFVVRVFAVGAWNGWPYLVMELVQGEPVARLLRAGPLPVDRALRIAEELASALAAVHREKVMHRDVNPSNVLLRSGDGSACLIDFGLAQGLDRVSHTSGTIAGTLHYMAPEQLERRRHDVRVDVYAFGATLFEMLTGRLPHAEEDTPSLIRTILTTDAPLLRSLRPDAPRALEVLVARALSRAPEFRPADGAALLEEVRATRRALAAGEPAAAPPERVAEGTPVPLPAPAPPRDPAEELPFLGRNEEYAAAVRALGCVEARRGGVLLVEGPVGSGKSRFLREVQRAARARAMAVLCCEGSEFSGAPYRALREGLLDHARALGAASPAAVVARVVEASPGSGPLAPALRWFLDPSHEEGDPRPARSELTQAVLALLRALLRERPALLVVEDLHLLDAGTLDILGAVGEESPSWPLVLAVSFRSPETLRPGSPLGARLPRLRAVPGAVDLRLGPLSEAAVAAMIHSVLRVAEADACRLAPLLQRKSSGNPLYLVESLKLLEQEGKVRTEVGVRRFRQRVSSLAIPPRLLELAVRRISGVPQAERDALGVACIDPDGVSSDLVAGCLEVSRMRALRTLQHLVRPRGMLRQDGDRYVVAHGEIREAVYADLIPELRASWHGEAARALEARGAGASEPARLGRHLRLAGRKREAVAPLTEAGRRLLHGHAAAQAVEYFDDALACAGDEGAPAAAVGRAQALELLGELEGARATLEGLVARGGAAEAEAILPLAEFERNRGRDGPALDLLGRAAGIPLPPDRRLRLFLLQAQIESRLGHGDEALRVLELGERLAAGASAVRRLELLNTRGTICWRLRRNEEARECFARALPLAEEVGALDRTAILLFNLGLACTYLDAYDEALEWTDKAVERSLLIGNDRTLAFALLLRADLLTRALRLDDSARTLDRAEAIMGRLDSADAAYVYADARAGLALARQEWDEALRWAREGLRTAGDVPQKAAALHLQSCRALLESGRAAAALETARHARAALLHGPGSDEAEMATALAARALRELGREGPEREEMRRVGTPRTLAGAMELAADSREPPERQRWLAEARRLARNAHSKAELERRFPGEVS